MYLFRVHQIESGGNKATVYELVKSTESMLVAVLKSFSGASFPVFLGSKKRTDAITAARLYDANGRTFGRAFSDVSAEAMQQMMADTFGGTPADYDSIGRVKVTTGAEELFFLHPKQPISPTIEIGGEMYVDGQLKADTQIVLRNGNGDRGYLFPMRGVLHFVVFDKLSRYTLSSGDPLDIATWAQNTEEGEYGGHFSGRIDYSVMHVGSLHTVEASDPLDDQSGVREKAKEHNPFEMVSPGGIGFVLRPPYHPQIPIVRTSFEPTSAVTAIAAASRDGVLLKDMDWVATKPATEVGVLTLEPLF